MMRYILDLDLLDTLDVLICILECLRMTNRHKQSSEIVHDYAYSTWHVCILSISLFPSSACNVGDEGGFAPNILDNMEGMLVWIDIIPFISWPIISFTYCDYA